jgi:hypothetical protein
MSVIAPPTVTPVAAKKHRRGRSGLVDEVNDDADSEKKYHNYHPCCEPKHQCEVPIAHDELCAQRIPIAQLSTQHIVRHVLCSQDRFKIRHDILVFCSN